MIEDVAGVAPVGAFVGEAPGRQGMSRQGEPERPASVSKPASQDRGADIEAVKRAAARVAEVFRRVSPGLRIEIQTEGDRIVVRILNRESGEMIRQIPSQELLEIARRLEETQGALLQHHA